MVQFSGFKFACLPSAMEWERTVVYVPNVPITDNSWWLSTKGTSGSIFHMAVTPDGNIINSGVNCKRYLGIRPLFQIKCLSSAGLHEGDKVRIGKLEGTVIHITRYLNCIFYDVLSDSIIRDLPFTPVLINGFLSSKTFLEKYGMEVTPNADTIQV